MAGRQTQAGGGQDCLCEPHDDHLWGEHVRPDQYRELDRASDTHVDARGVMCPSDHVAHGNVLESRKFMVLSLVVVAKVTCGPCRGWAGTDGRPGCRGVCDRWLSAGDDGCRTGRLDGGPALSQHGSSRRRGWDWACTAAVGDTCRVAFAVTAGARQA
jgi:hypothetical protein